MIRVLRLMEYEYPDSEMAEADMASWHLPANGTRSFGANKTIRSSTIINLAFHPETEQDTELPPRTNPPEVV